MDDEGVEIDVMEEDYQPINQDPPIFYEIFETVIRIFTDYGWYVLLSVCILYYLYVKLAPRVRNYLDSTTATHKKFDSSEIERRQIAVEAHRRKLQEEHDRKAAEYAAKQAELEQKRRQEKLEDWERHQSGLGYRSKVKKAEESSSPEAASSLPKPKKKLRDPDYNPLMGSDGPSCSWRPGRRGPAAGG